MSSMSSAPQSVSRRARARRSPIRGLLANAEQIGAVYRMRDFREALVITNDLFVRRAHGVPQHSFLLAAAADLKRVADTEGEAVRAQFEDEDEEVILLRVAGNAALPQETDLQYLRAQAGIDLVVEAGMEQPRSRELMIDALTENQMQTSGLGCTVLGTFYDADSPSGPCLAFGSDVDNVFAATRLRVFKPHSASLEAIVGFMAEQVAGETRRRFPIGRVRYASTQRREHLAARAGMRTDVPVEIDIADFVAHKTAVLGMTRKGKSNTNKVLATMTHQYAREQDMPIGQLIFDPAGEYANVNVQDKTALASLGAEHVVRFRLGASEEELRTEEGLRMLALNFFDEKAIGVVWGLIGEFLRRQHPNTQYVQAFINAEVQGPDNPQSSDDWRQASYARRARMMMYGCLLKAGLKPPTRFEMWVPLKAALRTALMTVGHPRGEDLSFLNTVSTSKRGDQVCLGPTQIRLVCEAIAANFHSSSTDPEIAGWMDTKDQRGSSTSPTC